MTDAHAPPYLILIVDDSAPITEMLTVLLNEEPQYYAKGVVDSAVALELARLLRPDLLILDLVLPALDGLELYDLVQQIPFAHNVPVLFVTADIEGERRIRERGLPVVAKPFDVEDVLEQVAALVGRAA